MKEEQDNVARLSRMGSAAFYSVLPAVFVSLASLWMYLNPGIAPIEAVDAESVTGKALTGLFYLSAGTGISLGIIALFRRNRAWGPAVFAVAVGSLLLILDQVFRS
jgi:hypothetical protein